MLPLLKHTDKVVLHILHSKEWNDNHYFKAYGKYIPYAEKTHTETAVWLNILIFVLFVVFDFRKRD